MAIQVNFELSDKDLEHFRNMMKLALEKASQYSDAEVLEKATQACQDMEQSELPDFVSERLHSLEALIRAVQDDEWQMPEEEKKEIITSLAYFCEPQDLVPDEIPGLGYIDDAIMIELVIQDMSLDLKAYREFCSFRSTEEARRGEQANVDRESWLDSTRAQIRSNMRRNRQSSSRRRIFSRIM